MKKDFRKAFICFILIASAFISIIPVSAKEPAQQTIWLEDGSTVTYFEDGSKLTVSSATTTESASSPLATAKTVSSSKNAIYEDSDGTINWKYTLLATFSYVPGVSSTCTSASYTQTIYKGNWTFSNGSATKSGNTAYGNGTFVLKFLFITAKTIDVDISLTCDVNGNVT